MTAQEFIKKTLKEWVSRFNEIKLRYAYDAVTEYHIVEVKPEEIRRGNLDYKKLEMKLWLDFMELFPDECLLISAPSDANDMTNLLFETKSVWKILSCMNVFSDSIGYTQYDYYKVYSDNTKICFNNNYYYSLAA